MPSHSQSDEGGRSPAEESEPGISQTRRCLPNQTHRADPSVHLRVCPRAAPVRPLPPPQPNRPTDRHRRYSKPSSAGCGSCAATPIPPAPPSARWQQARGPPTIRLPLHREGVERAHGVLAAAGCPVSCSSVCGLTNRRKTTLMTRKPCAPGHATATSSALSGKHTHYLMTPKDIVWQDNAKVPSDGEYDSVSDGGDC